MIVVFATQILPAFVLSVFLYAYPMFARIMKKNDVCMRYGRVVMLQESISYHQTQQLSAQKWPVCRI